MGTSSRIPSPLGALVLVLCALVAATFDGPRWDDARPGEDRPTPVESDADGGGREEAAPEADAQPPAEDDDEPWLPWAPRLDLLLLLPAALVFGVALLVISRLRLVRRRKQLTRRVGVRSPPAPGEGPPDEDVAADLPSALDEGVRAIGEGSARNAIVAAWVRLEQAVENERFAHRPHETPSELVERVLAAYRLDAVAIRRLAELYREARFSSHPVTEDHRAEAADCLRRLLASLGARSR